MLRFSDGINIDTSGELRHLELHDGHYVVGQGLLIPTKSKEDSDNLIKELKGSPELNSDAQDSQI